MTTDDERRRIRLMADPAAMLETCVVRCRAKCCRNVSMMTVTTAEKRRLEKLAPPLAVLRFVNVGGWRADTWLLDPGPSGNMVCPFLAPDNRCSIHADRPMACRLFPDRPYPGCLVWPAPIASMIETTGSDGP